MTVTGQIITQIVTNKRQDSLQIMTLIFLVVIKSPKVLHGLRL